MTPRLDLMTNSEATEYLREVWQANRGLVGEERFQRRCVQSHPPAEQKRHELSEAS